MKKLGKKGFTLVELLAVITIMGILMLVAIPAVSRTIENSRRDTFMDTAKAYVNAIKNAVAADELYSGSTPISALGQGYYYYSIESDQDSGKDLMEQGGKSSWGNTEVKGYVVIYKTVTAGDQGRTKYEYAIKLVDMQGRGIANVTTEGALKRSSVATSGTALTTDDLKNAAKAPPSADGIEVSFSVGTKYISQNGKGNKSGDTAATAAPCTALSIG